MTNLMVHAQNVRKKFGDIEVLKGVNLEVRAGTVTCLLGASGSGKSTFLRCINHLEQFDSGRLLVDGEWVGYRAEGNRAYELTPKQQAQRRSQIGMVFQQFNLFPNLTVLENVMLAPLLVHKEDKRVVLERATHLLERVGLADKGNANPSQLSGGQQQRAAIARALATRPKLMLFDEPTSALDPELVGEVLDVMRGLADDGITMIVVTHEINFAREVADAVAFLHNGEVIEEGPPSEVLLQPRQIPTQDFLKKVL
jgi:ABC-type polar amino acid transport system, ATPase component